MSADQWKELGLCDACRRKPYCRKTCRAKRERIRRAVSAFVEKASGIDRLKENLKELKNYWEETENANLDGGDSGDGDGAQGADRQGLPEDCERAL